MPTRLLASLALLTLTCSPALAADTLNWPQFRGPNAAGIAIDADLPDDLEPAEHLLWKAPVARGHSSPVIWGDRIYLTALDGEQLQTIALDRATGSIVWKADAPHDVLEEVHRVGSPATSSVATDGRHVISFFGSCGLLCHDADGRQLWHVQMGPFDNNNGAASSPIIVDGLVVLAQDHDIGSFIAAYDVESGSQVWRSERPNFRRNYGTPIVWEVAGRRQIVLGGTAQVTGYDLASGELIWSLAGVARVVNSTPIVGDDGRLYLATSGGGLAERHPSFDEQIASADANGNGGLEKDELPEGIIKSYHWQFDRDDNELLDRTEYESIREVLMLVRNVALAIEPGGRGDVTDTHLAWQFDRSVPRNASPVYYQGHLYLVKDGGIVTSLHAETGELIKMGRVRATGSYFSSPIVADGKIYLLSDRGQLTVLSAAPDWEELDQLDLDGEEGFATPAIVGNRLYVRTGEHLYCFGEME